MTRQNSLIWYWVSSVMACVRFSMAEGDGGGGEGGEGGGGSDKTYTADDLRNAIEREVSGLRSKNQELLGNQSKLKERLEMYGGVEPDKVQEMLRKLENDEDANLLKDGKIDELVEKRVDKISAEYESKLSETAKQLEDAIKASNSYQNRYNQRVIHEQIMKASLAAGIRSEAMEDVITKAEAIFTVGDDDDLEARDTDGNLRKLGDKLLTSENWIESLRESCPHYWPESTSAGLRGNRTTQKGKLGDLSARLAAAAEAGDQDEYRRLRSEQRKAQKR